jgi:hypothetical protein
VPGYPQNRKDYKNPKHTVKSEQAQPVDSTAAAPIDNSGSKTSNGKKAVSNQDGGKESTSHSFRLSVQIAVAAYTTKSSGAGHHNHTF